ncbi:hypothetical protein L1049_008959 [Liquidambar formosana]|uniref:Uncharacterized protein n=1 Tax=Liquidambar formosana TaxID=63359 RepID=A0AAP0S3S9_LIQFO
MPSPSSALNRHLKSFVYIVGRHGVPWTMKSDKNCSVSSYEATLESNGISNRELEVDISAISLVRDIQINEVKPNFDIYTPNSKFRKSCPW